MRVTVAFTLSALLALTTASCVNQVYDKTHELADRLWIEMADYQDEMCLEYMISPDEFSAEMRRQIEFELEGADLGAVSDFLTEKCGNADVKTRTHTLAAYLWESIEDHQGEACTRYASNPEEFADEMFQEITREIDEADPQVVADFLSEQCN